ncbi:MAG: XdhC family protein, partial [Phormidesmis sp.]
EYALDALNPECFIEDCFIETIQPPPVLLIIGGGHVAVALAQMADFAGFQIAVQDDRPEFVTPERFPQARLLSRSIRETVDSLTPHSQLYIALVARGFSQDVEALQTLLLQRPWAYQYVGAIGSQKRIRSVCQAVQQQGISIDSLPNFHAPIGLDIGALTPQEIAISICAELIKVRRGGTGRSLCDRIQHSSAPAKVHVGEQLYASLP